VAMTSARSGQPGINGTEYASLPVPVPPVAKGGEPPAEQQRIAACLGSLDALIAAASRKLDGLRAHKKGLTQQLFPSPEGE
jgi:type I restriction enzyme, S subunit